jgi:pimeloyl-ACP methyl ester carboxylesterase
MAARRRCAWPSSTRRRCALILISTAFARNGWYPEAREGMSAVSGAMAEPMRQSPMFQNYAHPEQFARFLDRMGELLSQDYDWREEARALPMPVLLLYADHDSISLQHIAEFFALFGGGISEPGWEQPKFSQARLGVVPGYSHYNFGQSPELARLIENYLTRPTSTATQFTPEGA